MLLKNADNSNNKTQNTQKQTSVLLGATDPSAQTSCTHRMSHPQGPWTHYVGSHHLSSSLRHPKATAPPLLASTSPFFCAARCLGHTCRVTCHSLPLLWSPAQPSCGPHETIFPRCGVPRPPPQGPISLSPPGGEVLGQPMQGAQVTNLLTVGSPTDPCGRSVGHFTPICMFPTRSMWGFPKYCPTFLWSPAPTSAESGMPCIYQTFPPPTWPQEPQACSPMQRAHLQFPSAMSSCAANTVMVAVSHKAPGIVQFSQLPLTLSRHNPTS